MKTIHSDTNKLLLEWLTTRRLLSGMTQQKLSEKLNRPQSFVSKYENSERRLDLIEILEICDALDLDPHELLDEVIRGKRDQ